MFLGEKYDELAFVPDDIIEVFTDVDTGNPGWLRGRCDGFVGLFPAAFAEALEMPKEDQQPAPAPAPLSDDQADQDASVLALELAEELADPASALHRRTSLREPGSANPSPAQTGKSSRGPPALRVDGSDLDLREVVVPGDHEDNIPTFVMSSVETPGPVEIAVPTPVTPSAPSQLLGPRSRSGSNITTASESHTDTSNPGTGTDDDDDDAGQPVGAAGYIDIDDTEATTLAAGPELPRITVANNVNISEV